MSRTRPSASSTIRSARRTVASRWAITSVVRPSDARGDLQPRVVVHADHDGLAELQDVRACRNEHSQGHRPIHHRLGKRRPNSDVREPKRDEQHPVRTLEQRQATPGSPEPVGLHARTLPCPGRTVCRLDVARATEHVGQHGSQAAKRVLYPRARRPSGALNLRCQQRIDSVARAARRGQIARQG